MSKFKVGDKVRSLVTESDVVKDRIYQVVRLNYRSVDVLDDAEDEYTLNFNEIEIVEKTLDNLEVGDVLTHKISGDCLVLAVCGQIVATSENDNFDAFDEWTPIPLMKSKGWTVKSAKSEPQETIEIGGIKYDKDEVEAKLKDIKPVK